MSISEKIIKGGFWNSIAQFGVQGINFVITIILARMLGPSAFGLVGMVTIFTTFFGYFSELGLIPCLIRKKEIDEVDTNTVFWASVGLSGILYVIIFFAAPLIALFYQKPELTLVTRVLFIYFLVIPLSFIPITMETRKLQYRKIAMAELISSILGGIVAIIIAVLGGGIWALIFMQIISVAVKGIVMLLLTGWKPRCVFSWQRLKEFLGEGLHFTLNNLILYFSQNIDYLLIGKILGPVSLGYYTMAFKVSKYPITKITTIFGKMLFPAFSSFIDDKEKVRRNVLKISFVVSVTLTPVFFSAIFGLEPIVRLLLGQKWLPIVPVALLFFSYLIVNCFCIADDAVLMASGRVRTLVLVKAVSSAFLAGVGLLAVRYFELIGMAWTFTIVTTVYLILLKIIVLKDAGLKISAFLKFISGAIFFVLLNFIVFGLYSRFIPNDSFLYLVGEGILALLSYLVIFRFYLRLNIKNKTVNIRSFPGNAKFESRNG